MEKEMFGEYVHMLSRQLKRKVDEYVADYGITGVQSAMISYIYKESQDKNVFAKDIEKEFDIRRASIAGLLQNMEKNGLIKREIVNGDARLRKIILTEKALDLRRKVENNIFKVEKQALQGITEEELASFIKLAKKMSSNL